MASFFSYLRSLFTGGCDDASRDLVSRIVEAHTTLVNLDSLQPGEITNKTLGGLVSLCCESHDSSTINKVLTHPRIQSILPSLRHISSASECCLESYWADQIVSRSRSSTEALSLLKSFPYFQNYVDLARLELHALYAVEPAPVSRIAFVGSGPLPLTSMCLLRSLRDGGDDDNVVEEEEKKERPTVMNIDHNATALSASTVLCEKLGSWSAGMAFRCSDANSDQDLSSFDVVFLAALVGVTQRDKEEIVISVARRMRKGALMVVRSAYGLKTVLYPLG
ncbi:hypothetical protein TruAng_002210 [Truncatella angustata]|nr:hypothetical protein TruAng_002210 [Truncatella angustata]